MGNADSKNKFQEGVQKLVDEEVAADNDAFWNQFWKTTTTAEEVFGMIHPDDVRHLRKNQPGNLVNLFGKALDRIESTLQNPQSSQYSETITCVRILTRLVPFCLEDSGDDFLEDLLWAHREGKRPTAERILDAVLQLLFLPDFTVTSASYKAYKKIEQEGSGEASNVFPPLIWTSGCLVDSVPNLTMQYDRNRREILRLLLVCVSETLFGTPETHNLNENRWLHYICRGDHPLSLTLFFSLLNTTVSYDPVGWGVPFMGSLAADDREVLADICVQILIILLDFGLPSRIHTTEPSPSADAPAVPSYRHREKGEDGYNVFRSYLSRTELFKEKDMHVVLNGISRILNNVHEAQNTYFPNSVKRMKCYQEVLMLLWKTMDENENFLRYILKKSDVNKLVVPLLYIMYENRKDPAKVGLIHICTFILLLFSGERDFGVALNKPFELKLPTDLPLFAGSHTDLLVVVLHKLVVNGYEKLNAVYHCFLTIISNVSPYSKRLAMVSTVRLMRLYKLFSSPRFLLSNESNHALVALLLDTFNNIIQYQYEGNQSLVYAMLREKHLFYRLRDLTIASGSVRVNTPSSALLKSTPKTGNELSAMNDQDDKASETASVCSEFRGDRTTLAPSSSTVGGARFIPTPEWLDSWKSRLPLNTVLRLLQHLEPQVEEMCKNQQGSLDESMMMTFLENTTLVGLLPVPHPIVIRKYQPNQYTDLWFTTFTWGVVFLRNQDPPLFDGTAIKLFVINVL